MSPLLTSLTALACTLIACVSPAHPLPSVSSEVFNHASTTEKVVALTFDADMTPRMRAALHAGRVASWYDASVIDTLTHEQVPATLFITGMWAEEYPTTTAALAQNPLFEIGNHSYSHGGFTAHCYRLAPIPVADQEGEVTRTNDILTRVISRTPVSYFRYPGLCSNASTTAAIARLGFRVIAGDVMGGDGFQHDALPGIIAGLRERGYRFAKVSELLSLEQ